MSLSSLAVLASESSSSSRDNFASFEVAPWIWVAFLAFVSALLIGDLLLVHRKPHAPTTKEAAIESAVWIGIGLAFTGVMFGWHGGQAATEYISGYLIEKSLSVDNVFVWALIMSYFAVPREFQFRVLFWGIFGALVLRFVFIFAGVALLERFDWMLFVFGGFLLITAVRMVRHKDDEEVHPEHNPVLRLVRRVIPSTTAYDGQQMFVRHPGALLEDPGRIVLHPQPPAVHPPQVGALRREVAGTGQVGVEQLTQRRPVAVQVSHDLVQPASPGPVGGGRRHRTQHARGGRAQVGDPAPDLARRRVQNMMVAAPVFLEEALVVS